jgi:2,4-dienoyl-CoA reductase-like NADH-dependent reductase (Old Yellow Enzyme family)
MFVEPRALTGDEIRELIERFAFTAKMAKETGFSGIQIHSAHGYLNSQFLSPLTNRRDDEWGGPLENRMRFLLSNVRAARSAVGTAFPISVKLNSADFQRGGFSEVESMQVVAALEAEGVDLLEISGGNYEMPMMVATGESKALTRESSIQREAFYLNYAKKVRAKTRMPLMLTGGLRSVEVMESIVADGSVDCVGLARPLALDPDFSRKAMEHRVERAPQAKVNIGIKMFDDMLQSLWYQEQLHLMGAGRDPKINYSRLVALAKGMWNLFG